MLVINSYLMSWYHANRLVANTQMRFMPKAKTDNSQD